MISYPQIFYPVWLSADNNWKPNVGEGERVADRNFFSKKVHGAFVQNFTLVAHNIKSRIEMAENQPEYGVNEMSRHVTALNRLAYGLSVR